MERVLEFLRRSKLQYCATVGLDGKPKVRPFQMMFNDGGDLYYCTGAQKDVYSELMNNPYLEISVSEADKWLRIRGRVQWVDGQEIKERILGISPLVKSIYKSADNPVLKVFYIAEAEAVIADFSGTPVKIRLN